METATYSTPTVDALTNRGHAMMVDEQKQLQFDKDGFISIPQYYAINVVDSLRERLEHVLRGQYDRAKPPDKTPKIIKDTIMYKGPLGFTGNLHHVKVLQVINVHKCDSLFRTIATDPALGKLVATLAGWKHGVRLAQDQVWAKPPGASALVFHRDSPYFMFNPPDIVTVWLALDDMDEELGPLEYVKGSHKWGDGRVGTSNQFFGTNGKALLKSAAEREGIVDLDFVSMAGLRAGGISIHHGRTWHGSGPNTSKTRPRRGLGLHFCPGEVTFTAEATKSKLWRRHVEGVTDVVLVELSDGDFPVTWHPSDDIQDIETNKLTLS